MKKFKDLIEADAKDYKGDDESQKDYDTASSDEEKFKQLHFTHNADLAKIGREHPVAPDYVFSGERPGGAKGDAGADHKGYDKPGEPILKTYKDFVTSMRSAAKPGGDKAPVMQGSSKIKEEVEYIDEAFKKGMLKLKDGKSVKVDEATAKMLNNAMKQLNPGNRKKMETEAMKDKKSFDAMVTFAKAAT
tara:strand:- start:187 stop:756 length:570 start_codon:yes stop_codon:yes gene_type:complete